MKNMITILLTALFLSSCASTMQTFHSTDVTTEGIRFQQGAQNGVAVGDRIVAYKKILIDGAKSMSSIREKIGFLTVVKVENDYSIMKKNGEFELNHQVTFSKE